jgi:hypothetical protein
MRRNELKNQILNILREIPETRNSDITLSIELWKRYHPEYIKKNNTGELGIWLKDLYNLPSQDNVKRIRALVQNEEGKFLPTSWEVAKQRKIKEEEWLNYIRDNSEYKRI